MNQALRNSVTNIARHLLRHRHRQPGPASLLSDVVARRLPVDHRRRGPGAAASRRKAGSRILVARRRRLERHGPFHPFLDEREVRILAVDRRGGHRDRRARGRQLAGKPGILRGQRSYLLQDEDGQWSSPLHFGRARLSGHRAERPGSKDQGRIEVAAIPRRRGRKAAFSLMRPNRGILPALEPAHAPGPGRRRRHR